MKLKFKIFSFLFVLAFCLQAVNASTSILPFHNDEISKTLKKSFDKGAISSDSHALQTKEYDRVIVEYITTNTPSLFVKNSDSENAIALISKHLFALENSKYTEFLKSLNLNFLTIDIIYPFHSFW